MKSLYARFTLVVMIMSLFTYASNNAIKEGAPAWLVVLIAMTVGWFITVLTEKTQDR